MKKDVLFKGICGVFLVNNKNKIGLFVLLFIKRQDININYVELVNCIRKI